METIVETSVDKEEVAKTVSYLKERFRKLASQYNADYLGEACHLDTHLRERLSEYTSGCYEGLERNLQNKETPDPASYFTQTGYAIHAGKTKTRKLIYQVKNDYLYNSRKLFQDFLETSLQMQRDVLKEGHDWIIREVSKLIEDNPEWIHVFYKIEELKGRAGDKFSSKLFKFRMRAWSELTRKPVKVRIPLRQLLAYHLPGKMRIALYALMKNYGKAGYRSFSGYRTLFRFMKHSFINIEESLIRGDFSHELLDNEKQKALEIISRISLDPGNRKTKPSSDEPGNDAGSNGFGDAAGAQNNGEKIELDNRELVRESVQYDAPPEFREVVDKALANVLNLIKEDLNRPDINGLMNRRKQISINTGEKLKGKIAGIPDLWYRNQNLHLSAVLLDLMLQTAQVQLSTIVQKVMGKVQDNFDNNVLHNLKQEHHDLEEFSKKIKSDPYAEYKAIRSDWGYARDKVFYKEINDKFLADVREAVSIFPDTIEIIGEIRAEAGRKTRDAFDARQFDKTESLSISLNRLVNYLILTNLSEPIRMQLIEIPVKLEKTISIADDVTRLISFSLNNPDRDFSREGPASQPVDTESLKAEPNARRKEELQKSIIDFIHEGDLRIQKELNKVKEQQKRSLFDLSQALDKTVASLEPEVIISSAGNLHDYIKKSKKRKSVLDRYRSIKPGLKSRIAKIWYRRSESLLAARRLSLSSGKLSISAALWKADEEDGELRLDELLTLIEEVSPDQQVLDRLPFYYRQLFLGKQNVDRAFWTGRGAILLQAQKAVNRFRHGMQRQDSLSTGGLLIVGEQNSGKTYLSQYIAGKYFNKRKTYQIDPPDAGSTDIHVFGQVILKAINSREEPAIGAKARTLMDIEKDSVFIFNDIELWWERSRNGLAVIEQMLKIVNQYGGKLFFIFNANIHSFRHINKLTNFSDSFQKMLECEPFSAEELKDIILFRHKSTGIKYRMNNRREDEIPGWRQARLFSRYFNYSKGNVGVALNAWISNIHAVTLSDKAAELSVSKGTGLVQIREPRIPNLDRLRHLNSDWLLVIIQFILHKKMTVEKLARIAAIDQTAAESQFNHLLRAGVIMRSMTGRSREKTREDQEKAGGAVYELNPFLRPHLVNDLVERGIL